MRCGGLLPLLMLAFASPVLAQTTVQEAREEGKAFGKGKSANDALVPSEGMQNQVPFYAGTDLPQSQYFDDPDKLVADGGAQASSSEAVAITTDRARTRAQFDAQEILATTARASEIESNPDAYLQGEQLGGDTGSCTPLPQGGGNVSYYEATCNYGAAIKESSPMCTAPLVVATEGGEPAYSYKCDDYYYAPAANRSRLCSRFDPYLASGQCRVADPDILTIRICLQSGPNGGCYEPDFMTGQRLECSSPVITDLAYTKIDEGHVVSEAVDEGQCSNATAGKTCELVSETCVDADPSTRTINGVSVTRACWAWQRSYQCHAISQGNDCGDLDANAQCTYVRDECIDDEDDPNYDPAACKVSQKVYRCPVPSSAEPSPKQYVCGDDVYCINGDCEPIEREASTEFKDALVALHALGQAGDEFDEDNFTVFSGDRQTCHKPVFGLINCCAGKTSGLLTLAAGGAALAGGPAALAAVATPFLTLFACSSEEKMLDVKDRMGFCHKVGTYCSSSILGICQSKKTAYCCFESKLSRILQEQGRPQINKPWGKPKKEQCEGFTIDEFARLDLSLMDFTEVYSEFTDAAKLPDEVSTLADIQTRIQDYYDLHTSQ
ncbi:MULTISPECIES: conjugal transfer protein TraN [unclassified Novosphingobium]|uniref:conjugal transfer protein TraN n=1 Tax=unclassified Novosphingobium TaxID=2644732 RepID=UPI00104672DB|nr:MULTISPECIES: conjugal transfer protein TraN [unclassified Novosphingobium]MPS71211.1 conjugal transfer protein TraN [Novosphingobium sp.]TCM28096.1 conjugal transfer mating pair stabilization protein TraN [Novosphingobium sp. ST904]